MKNANVVTNMNTRSLIKDLEENKETFISGFVTSIRDTKYMLFLVVKDRTGSIQVSFSKEENKDIIEKVETLTISSVVKVYGKKVLSEYVKNGGCEFIPEDLEILSISSAMPIDTSSAEIDVRLDYRWIDLREDKNTLIFKIQTTLVKALRDYLYQEDFIEIHSPKLTGTASESGSDVFEVKYFDTSAYLAQSPQFYKQMAMAAGLERIFEVGPVYRAEKSFTNRHSTEFTSFDIEFSYINSYEDVMKLEENMLIYALDEVEKKWGKEIEKVFGTKVVVPKNTFPVITLDKLYEELKTRYGYDALKEERGDLTSEAEKLAYKFSMEEYNSEFLFVIGYSKEKRAFYHMRDENDRPLGYDLIWKGTEITTGAQREHRYEILKKQAEEKGLHDDVKFYLEFFKYGCPPHGGFGLGIDRLTMLLLNLPSIKESEFLFRSPNRLNP